MSQKSQTYTVELDYKGLANMGTWMVGTLQTEQDRDRLDDGLTGAGLEKAAVARLLSATRKRVFLLHDVHRPEPCLLHSRWAMSYLRGPLTRGEIERLSAAGPAVPPPATGEASLSQGPPLLPPPFETLYLQRNGGELAQLHLVVKHAARYKGAGETVGSSAWPLAAASAAEALESERFAVEEGTLGDAAPEALQYAGLPEWLDDGAAKAIEKALRDRLPDKLAVRVYKDPLIGERSSEASPDP